MIKQLLIGLWICAVTLGGVWAAGFAVSGSDSGAKIGALEYVSNEPITIPIVKGGMIEGYVIAKLIFSGNSQDLQQWGDKLKLVFTDSVFRIIYAAEHERMLQNKRQDLDPIVEEIKVRTNKAIGSNVIGEVLVEYLNYVSLDQVRCNRKSPGTP
jgi:hypothetical protein